jgi:hypothetical protein
MIGQRFRSLGWVAGVATAATCLYLVSLQVAAERGKLEAVEHQIATAQRDMRQLQTELGTRASLRQLEKWNGDVLALSAPKARQFLHSETQLASLGSGSIDDGTPNAPPAVMNASFEPAPALTTLIAVPKQADEPTSVRAGFQRAIFVKPVIAPRTQRVAMLDAKILGDIDRSAAKEARESKQAGEAKQAGESKQERRKRP